MPVTIPAGGGTFVAVEGETYILSPNTTGNISFTGDAAFNVEINDSQTGGANNQFSINFGAGTDPSVTYAAGVNASSHQLDANGDSLTVNVGAGAMVGELDSAGVTGPTGAVLDIGDNVTINGGIDGPNALGTAANYTIGSDVQINGNLTGGFRSDTTVAIGDNFNLTGTFGESSFGETATHTVNIGNDATIGGGVTFAGAESATFQAGDNFSIGGTFTGSGRADEVIFGDNWFVDGSVSAGGGDDQFFLGFQGTTDSTNFRGDAGNDGITVAAPPGDEANFVSRAVASGWIDNGNGTVSSTTGSSFFSYNGHLYNSFESPATLVCFTAGTQIEVANGETVNVEDLAQGDMVMTAHHGLQPVKWIGVNRFEATKLAGQENLRPIRIAAGALGGGIPESDLLVSPQHRILVRSRIAQHMFGKDEVLVAAKHLILLDGIDVANDVAEVTYVHFLCDAHEIVLANGAATESLYTGPQAMKSVSPEAAAEIMRIFPELANVDYKALSAREIVNGRKGHQLAVRHKNKNRPLLAPLH